ncbi:MAG: GNAT family N-acetyltransferase [Acidobacteria bacterium]|nr:GNAT family N-acetyltransferase [Acidobacteriota bacterium]
MFRVIPEGMAFREHALLKDGQGVLLRPATPNDVGLVEAFMHRVSRESLRLRFMASISEVSRSTIEGLCSGDFTDRGCLLAVVVENDCERVVGLGNYVAERDGRTAELAFLVEDAFQGRGISTLLLERLAGLAAANGYVDFDAEVLPENQRMMRVFSESGFQVHRVWGADTIHVELPVTGAAAQREQAELRERLAAANSLGPVLKPRTVAVVGASREGTAIGNMIFRNLLAAGFAGTVYPINPQASSVHGVRAYPSLAEVPEPIDLAVIAVPAEAVQEAAEHAIQRGARGLVVMTAGFAEAGPEGAARQQRLVELVRAHGVRLVGPSCLGFMNTNPDVRLNASLAPALAERGRVGFFSHSAALGLVILEHAGARGIGFSSFVSAGNRADVSGNDLLQYWLEDADTDLAMLYLETFGNPRRFTRIARRVSARKPILCVKGARSRAGQRAAEARSGQPGTRDTEVEALFDQAGVIRAETLDEMFDVAVLVAHQPLPRGNRVAVIANSAGVATLLADAADVNGLVLGGTGLVNLGAFTTPERYEDAVKTALDHDEVDAVLVAYACVGDCQPERVTAAIGSAVHRVEVAGGVDKPVLLCIMGAHGTVAAVSGGNRRFFPAYRFPESAPRALAHLVRYAEFRRRLPDHVVWYEGVDAAAARREVQAALTEIDSDDPAALTPEVAGRVLAAFGIGVAEGRDGDLVVRVRPDPLFGPLIEVAAPGGAAVVRITPLTINDVTQVLEAVGAPHHDVVAETIGRVSQLIEELPWVWSLEGRVTATGSPALAPSTTLTVRRVASGETSRP